MIDALIESGSIRIEADTQDAVSGEGIAGLLIEECAHGLASGETDFQSTDELGCVVGVNACGGGGVEAREDPVEVGRAFASG